MRAGRPRSRAEGGAIRRLRRGTMRGHGRPSAWGGGPRLVRLLLREAIGRDCDGLRFSGRLRFRSRAAAIAIASETGRSSPKRSPARALEGASRPTQGPLTMATDRVVLALGIVGREVRASAIVNRVAPIRRHPHPYPVRTRSHSSSSRSETVATQKGSTSAPVVSANVPSTSSYRSSSSSPAYSSQTPRTEAASSAPAQAATSAPHPAGPTSLGGAVGSNCNPKCR